MNNGMELLQIAAQQPLNRVSYSVAEVVKKHVWEQKYKHCGRLCFIYYFNESISCWVYALIMLQIGNESIKRISTEDQQCNENIYVYIHYQISNKMREWKNGEINVGSSNCFHWSLLSSKFNIFIFTVRTFRSMVLI